MGETSRDFAQLRWRAAVSALWLVQAVNFIAYLLIVYLDGHFTDYSGLDDTAANPIVIAIFFAIPGLLICLSFAAEPRISRWPNVLFGALFTVIKILATAQILLGIVSGREGTFPGGLFLNELWAIFAGALLVWYAWRVPVR